MQAEYTYCCCPIGSISERLVCVSRAVCIRVVLLLLLRSRLPVVVLGTRNRATGRADYTGLDAQRITPAFGSFPGFACVNTCVLEVAQGRMHLGEPTKQALPDKWLADLLAKALLLEYQHPDKPTKPKGKRCGKKVHLRSKRKRASCNSKGNEKVGTVQAPRSTVGLKDVEMAAIPSRTDSNFQQAPDHSSWHLEDVPVFHLFAQVKRLLGR